MFPKALYSLSFNDWAWFGTEHVPEAQLIFQDPQDAAVQQLLEQVNPAWTSEGIRDCKRSIKSHVLPYDRMTLTYDEGRMRWNFSNKGTVDYSYVLC